jgi:hypothetical protein
MTPPGDPLQFNFGSKVQKNLNSYSIQFPHLKDQLEASITEAVPGSLAVVWRKKLRVGESIKGMKASVEAVSGEGKHAYFEVFYVEHGDHRAPVRITQGSFDHLAAAEFCKDFGGVLEKRRDRP